MPEQPDYDVFLSYSSVDAPQARALELGLQRLARPWYRPRALRVFRDRAVLPAGDDTWAALQKRLDHSRWLVLLASPEAAASSWVGDEVTWWRRHHTVDGAVRRLIIVRTSGELDWTDTDVEWATTTCLPEARRGAFSLAQTWAELPRPTGRPYVDLLSSALGGPLRRAHDPADRHVAAVLLDAVADVAATVRGVPKEEMVGEHRRRARHTRATVLATVAVVVALLVSLFGIQRQADDRRDAGTAAELVQRAAAARDVDPRLALRLGIAADRIHPDAHTRAGLVDTLTSTRYRGQLTGEAPAFDPRRPLAATIDYSGTTTLWDVSAPGPGRRLGDSSVGRGGVAVAFAPSGNLMATATANGAIALDDVTDPRHPVARGRTPDTRTQPDAGRRLPAGRTGSTELRRLAGVLPGQLHTRCHER